MATIPDLTLDLVLAKGDQGERGERGAPGVVSSASSYILVGPGRPDVPGTTAGTITGSEPVGARYESVDEAGVGARTWRKVAGNKWVVTDGDTGWRRVVVEAIDTSTAPDHGTLIRRVGPNVYYVIAGRTTTGSWRQFGVGWRPVASIVHSLTPWSGSTTVARLATHIHGAFMWAANPGAGFLAQCQITWATADTWPTTLPGDPA